jgi:chloramphenicol-sensitive protein RarD
MSQPPSTPETVRAGLLASIGAYALWGGMPFYIHAVSFANGVEVLAQRILWSAPAALAVILALDGWRKGAADLRAALKPKTFGLLVLSALFIAGNWGFYIWAVDRGEIISAALAYFLSPLVQMLAGVAFFRERLRTVQAAALALAGCGVVIQIVALGELPWATLALCLSWVGYGLVRKQAATPASTGFLIETFVLALPAVAALFYVSQHEPLAFLGGWQAALLLACAGPVTAVPLILFSFGVRRIQLTTMGVLQYITPSLQFFAGLFLGEHLSPLRLVGFGVIWLALIVFTWESLAADRAAKRARPSAAPQSP